MSLNSTNASSCDTCREAVLILKRFKVTKEAVWALAILPAIGVGTARAANPVSVVDVIPNASKAESNINSEPSLMVNPANANQVMIAAFNGTIAGGVATNNPYFVSTDQTNWSQAFKLDHNDTTLAWGNSEAYLTWVDGTNKIQVQASTTPLANPNSFAGVGFPAVAGGDQPWLATTSENIPLGNGTYDDLFVGYNNGTSNFVSWRQNVNGDPGGIPGAWQTATLPTAMGLSASVPVRVAGVGSAVYAAYEQYDPTVAGGDRSGVVTVAKTAVNNLGAIVGMGVVGTPSGNTAITIPFNTTVLGDSTKGPTERLGSDLSLAVNPQNANNVYVAYASVVNGNSSVTVKGSLDGGVTWPKSYTIFGTAALPALAVASSGEVGLLETDYSKAANTFDTWLYQFSPDLTNIGSLQELATFPDNGSAPGGFDPYLGDYQDLLAVGGSFYGTFSASNNPILADFPQGVYYDRVFTIGGNDMTGKLTANGTIGGGAAGPSIDPFFFTTAALPEPGVITLLAVGLLAGMRRSARGRTV